MGAAENRPGSGLRARALAGEGGLARVLGDYAQARALLKEALALADPCTNLAGVCLEPPTPRGADRTTAAGATRRPPLSDRQKAVLWLITEGLPNKQIATASA